MRTDRRPPIGTALLSAVFCACAAPLPCDTAEGRAVPSAGTARPLGCAGAAELLKRRVVLRPAPNPTAAATVVLMPGRSIYRCEQRGSFLGIMFPEEGGRVDCSMRSGGRECPTGWTDEPLETEITG